jgi:hypothetical protein
MGGDERRDESEKEGKVKSEKCKRIVDKDKEYTDISEQDMGGGGEGRLMNRKGGRKVKDEVEERCNKKRKID